MKLYSFAVLYHTTKEERNAGRAPDNASADPTPANCEPIPETIVVVPPTEFKLFANEHAVQVFALRDERVTEDMVKNADRLEVAVRPF